MNESQILEQLSLTDAYAPVMDMPESAWSHDVAFAEVERRIGVGTQTTRAPAQPTRTRQRGWFIAAAAFAVVIVVIGAAVLLARPADNVPPATTPSTTQAPPPTTTEVLPPTTVAAEEAAVTTIAPIVEADPVIPGELIALLDTYETVFNTGDEATFRALFAADFSWVRPEDSSGYRFLVHERVGRMTNSRIQESTLSIENCVPTSEGAHCWFIYSGAVETALYFGPVTNGVRVHAVEGKITEMFIAEQQNVQELQDTHGRRMLAWVAERFPDDRAKMWLVGIGVVNDGNGRDPVEVVELWTKYLPLWAEAGRP